MNYSVIVVGGGIIGTSTAYYLSKLGADVTLLEGKDIASGTSGSCDQAIMLQSKKPGPILDLGIESSKIYAELENELVCDLEYKKEGGMILIETEEEMEMMSTLVAQQQEAGMDVKLLSKKEAQQRQPGLSENILGSTWWDHDAKVNPLNVSLNMAKAAEKLGASIRLGVKVTSLITERNRVLGVEVSGEKLYADAIILALGVWTPYLLKPLGIDLPIIPRRGQILVTEKIPSFIHSTVLNAAYIAAKKGNGTDSIDPNNPAGVGLVIGQTYSGNLLIGGSREFVGFDFRTTPEVISAIGKGAVRVFPELENVRVLRTFAGLRPYTPDGMPIMGPVEGFSGLYLSAGHEGDGIALAPATGKVMAQVACGLDPGFDISHFSLNRFRKTSVV
ncbi:NAD(P)/FAD-dependent oxidoreductase [Jeotgalibacillus marinus]|uniref:FAD-dependent oxidoreductase n=1 Tax=Jeotgalibacillus marinus TaxID=86667 RepID=A0ABV3Q5N2_9BACL